MQLLSILCVAIEASVEHVCSQIYDGLVDAMAILVHDENKKRLHSQSVFPSSVMLKKGDHTIRVQICHEKPEFLEKLKDMVLVMVRTLEKPISLPIYPSRHALLSRGAQFCERQLHLGETTVLAIGNPTDELPKDCVPGKSAYECMLLSHQGLNVAF